MADVVSSSVRRRPSVDLDADDGHTMPFCRCGQSTMTPTRLDCRQLAFWTVLALFLGSWLTCVSVTSAVRLDEIDGSAAAGPRDRRSMLDNHRLSCNASFEPSELAMEESNVEQVNYTVVCYWINDTRHAADPLTPTSDSPIRALHVKVDVKDKKIASIEGQTEFTFSLMSTVTAAAVIDADGNTSTKWMSANTTPSETKTNVLLSSQNSLLNVSGSYRVRAIQFGRTVAEVTLAPLLAGSDVIGSTPDGSSCVTHDVIVRKADTMISLIYIIVIGVMIVIYNFGFGCKVDTDKIKSIVKRPVAPAIGFCCQFLIMSPLSFGVAQLLKLPDATGLGLLAIGSAPGGGGSNVFAFLLNGDLELSITMTFVSTVASLGMTPLWIWALGRFYTDDSMIEIPVQNVFTSLAIVTIPVVLGIVLNKFKPSVARKVAWCLKPATGVIGVVFIGMGVYVYYSALVRVKWQTLVSCVLVSFCGYSLGALSGKIFCQPRPRWITIALETGFQNLALSLMIIETSLEPPESDLAGVVPVCYTFLSAAMPATAFLIKVAVQLRQGNKPFAARDSLDITTDPDLDPDSHHRSGQDRDDGLRRQELSELPSNDCYKVKSCSVATITSENYLSGAEGAKKPHENGNIKMATVNPADVDVSSK